MTDADGGGLRYDDRDGRLLLVATVLGSAVVLLTTTIVNVALPAIAAGLRADLTGLQWVVDAELLALSSLLLLGGSLGDRHGRRRIFRLGLVTFALATALCGLAPTVEVLVVARLLQGTTAALLVPSSLAIVQSAFHPDDRGRAIGAWSAWTGIGAAIGPVLGGAIVDAGGWRAVFFVPAPVAVGVAVLAGRVVPAGLGRRTGTGLDVAGAIATVVGLGGIMTALLESGRGWTDPLVLPPLLVGLVALAALPAIERRQPDPMLPRALFSDRVFLSANLFTFVVYAALGGVLFLFVVHLQVVVGFRATIAGLGIVPITVLLLVLSPRAGALAQRIGPRRPLAAGAVIVAAGALALRTIGPGDGYLTGVLPPVLLFGVGLGLIVAPVTATALAAAPSERAGTASGVNNAVARTAQLLSVAVLPLAVGLGGDVDDPVAVAAGFRAAMVLVAGTALVGGLLALLTIPDDALATDRRPAAA